MIRNEALSSRIFFRGRFFQKDVLYQMYRNYFFVLIEDALTVHKCIVFCLGHSVCEIKIIALKMDDVSPHKF